MGGIVFGCGRGFFLSFGRLLVSRFFVVLSVSVEGLLVGGGDFFFFSAPAGWPVIFLARYPAGRDFFRTGRPAVAVSHLSPRASVFGRLGLPLSCLLYPSSGPRHAMLSLVASSALKKKIK